MDLALLGLVVGGVFDMLITRPLCARPINSESGTGFLFSKLSVNSHLDQALSAETLSKKNKKLKIDIPISYLKVS